MGEEERIGLEEELACGDSKIDDIINIIPGGVASYRVESGVFIPIFFSDGVMELSGHTRAEYEELIRRNAFDIIYEQDRERVEAAAQAALVSGEVLDVSYRMLNKNGSLIWIHLNGRRMGPLSDVMRFYAVFTGMSSETRLYESIANETADEIYVIDKKNYDLLYANESRNIFMKGSDCIGKKCYEALHQKDAPCEFCTLWKPELEGKEHEMAVEGRKHFYSTRFRETDWNGIPAYIKYVRDITEEVKAQREKERLETYFESIIKNLPGGVVVASCDERGHIIPELVSDGFAAMTEMPLQRARELYQSDIMAGVHPEDRNYAEVQMKKYIAGGLKNGEFTYRIVKGNGSYIWVKNTLSMIQNENGEKGIYAVYHDITKEREEKELLRKQYNEQLIRHYNTLDPNVLVVGHCNITKNRIIEIIDHTDSDLLKNLGVARESFFGGIGSLIVDEKEKEMFLGTYLNEPALEAFARGDAEQIQKCFVKFPKEEKGRYVQFKVNMMEAPDTGDVTGILTVTDITDQTISDRILYQLSVINYDFVIDLDLEQDTYKILTGSKKRGNIPSEGTHSAWMQHMFQTSILPKDQECYRKNLKADEICRRLKEEGPYTFTYSMTDENGEIRAKNMTVSEADLRLGRVCLIRTDITDSVSEQQGLLNVIAYTFDLLALITISDNHFVMYTRQVILENLPPYMSDNYEKAAKGFSGQYGTGGDEKEIQEQFRLEGILKRLKEKPSGYDFVFPYRDKDGGLRYKQINVLWGDENHRTVCLVRADVTEMLAAERETKRKLEEALAFAEEANKAKSEFLSSMSHDIRTPMNAIMGMTVLAEAHLDDRVRASDCLRKIAVSSRHLLSLINDVLDMSKIERSKISLNYMRVSLESVIEQLSSMMEPQAKEAGLCFRVRMEGIRHRYFCGDSLRINQVLINILSNAIKFTKEGGQVDFLIEEIKPVQRNGRVRYRFTISDNGIGMTEEFLKHIYEPFSRSHNAVRTEGTGLGLSITRGLVELMDGEIFVKSRVGEGTVFQVELEYEEASEIEEEASDNAKTDTDFKDQELPFAGRCFLAAEDNKMNAEILGELLEMYGASCVVKADGRQTVREFADTPQGTYDAVLMDIQMPEMNGYEAARAIRKMDRCDALRIPIIAMTANAFAEDVQAALASGMDAHVAKPIDLEVLKAVLHKVLG